VSVEWLGGAHAWRDGYRLGRRLRPRVLKPRCQHTIRTDRRQDCVLRRSKTASRKIEAMLSTMDCGGGAGQLPVELVIACANTKVQVTRHGGSALEYRKLYRSDMAGWIVMWQSQVDVALPFCLAQLPTLDRLKHDQLAGGLRLAAWAMRERRTRQTPQKRRLLRPAADQMPSLKQSPCPFQLMNPESLHTSR
jgi:hypothetical protein